VGPLHPAVQRLLEPASWALVLLRDAGPGSDVKLGAASGASALITTTRNLGDTSWTAVTCPGGSIPELRMGAFAASFSQGRVCRTWLARVVQSV
jgi:hypothetical protein